MSKPQQQSFRDWLIGLLHAVEQGPPAPDSAEVFADTILEALAKRLEEVMPPRRNMYRELMAIDVDDRPEQLIDYGHNTCLKEVKAAIRKELE